MTSLYGNILSLFGVYTYQGFITLHCIQPLTTMKLKHPFSMLVAGSRKAVKTDFTKNLLSSINEIINPPSERIIWCYSKHQPKSLEELMSINSGVNR